MSNHHIQPDSIPNGTRGVEGTQGELSSASAETYSVAIARQMVEAAYDPNASAAIVKIETPTIPEFPAQPVADIAKATAARRRIREIFEQQHSDNNQKAA